MSRYAPKTLRKMPPATREVARLANELASVQTRLSNRISRLASMEMMAGASEKRVFCSNGAHAEMVHDYLRAISIGTFFSDEARETLARLRRSVELDLDEIVSSQPVATEGNASIADTGGSFCKTQQGRERLAGST